MGVWRISFLMGLTAVLTMKVEAGMSPITQEPNTWVKRSPLTDTPISPRLGYEGACAWDSKHEVIIRYGGHNQGGGGEQNSEIWTFDPFTARWTLKEPNTSPPGVCCAQQDVFDPIEGRFVRFPAFSGSHGWQWFREIYMNDSTVWTYDLDTNVWRNLRPLPEPRVSPLRCASWDSDCQVIVLFGGEGNREGTLVYDPYTNTWDRLAPSTQPTFRSGGNMAYDSARKLHILFGSQFTDDPHTWTYSLRENVWRDARPEAMPHTDKNGAVLAYDSLNKVIIALVRLTEGDEGRRKHRLETWAYDAGNNTWSKMNPPQEPDPSGNRARVLMYAPELNLTILENRTHKSQGSRTDEQQIWTYRFAAPKSDVHAPLSPPTAVSVTATERAASVSWKPSPSGDVTGYAIYRGAGEKPWLVHYQRIHLAHANAPLSFTDQGVARETIYHYFLRALDKNGGEGPGSFKVRSQPRIVEDLVVSVLSATRVELGWTSPKQSDISGYHVERAVVEVWSNDQLRRIKSRTPPLDSPSVGAVRRIGRFTRLTREPIKAPRFIDKVDLTEPRTVDGDPLYEHRLYKEHLDMNGKPYRFCVYAYRIRAVNALGVESGPSPYSLTIPSAPRWVFSREDGDRCHLKWATNPEKGLRGYRVYRMNGRWAKIPIVRMTEEPISDSTYTDAEAGRISRRYYVVAVDALGQEGLPSAPVWSYREWRKYYVPFVGEWHQ